MRPNQSSENDLNDPDFQALLVECLETLERGESLNTEQLLEANPEHAEALSGFLADQQILRQVASEIRDSHSGRSASKQSDGRFDETIDSNPKSGTSPIGQRIRYIGEYEVLEEIARGGMGVVFKAQQQKLGRVVALKMILSGQLADDTDVERFHREARAAGRLKHPNIVAIHEIGEHEGHHYFTMDFVDGHSLSDEIRDETLSPRRAAELIGKVAEAVEFAHQQGTLHRDIKPANILLDGNNEPQVTDFGLAKVLDDDEELTTSGQILGTPSYMSPEQAAGKQSHVGPASDIYSLGAILYACLTGRAPFVADSPVDTLMQVIHKQPVSPRQLNPAVPVDLETICLKCLTKEPHKRYGTARDFADDLTRFLEGRPVTARPVGRIERSWRWCRRNPLAAASIVIGLSLLLTFAIGAPIVALQQKQIADQQKEYARQQAKIADQKTEIAKQQTEFAGEQQRFAKQEHELRLAAELAEVQQRSERKRVEQLLYASHLRSAQREWAAHNFDEAFAYLDMCHRDMRGWEHDFLYTRFTDQLKTIMGQIAPVASVAYSPDGRRVVVGGGAMKGFVKRSELKIWDAETSELVLELKGHQRPITSVAFSPDGKFVISGSEDKTIRIWNAATGEQIRQLAGHSSDVTSVAFGPRGKTIASGSKDKLVILWNAATGESIHTFADHTKPLTSLAFSPDGSQLIGGAGDPSAVGQTGELCAWETATRKLVWRNMQIAGAVMSVAYNHDGKYIVCAGGEFGQGPRGLNRFGELTLRQAATGDEAMRLVGHASVVRSAVFSPDGKDVVSVAADHTLKQWDAKTGSELLTLDGKSAHGASSVKYRPDGKQLAIGARAGSTLFGELRLWNPNPIENRPLEDFEGNFKGAAISPNGKQAVIAGDNDHALTLWDLQANRAVVQLTGHAGPVTGIAFSADGSQIVSGSMDQTVVVWDATTGNQISKFTGHTSKVACVAFSADGSQVVSGGGEMGVLGGAPVSPNADIAGELHVWDAKTGTEIWELAGHSGPVMSAAFSPDGRWIVSGGFGASFTDQGEVKVWNAETGKESLSLNGSPIAVFSVSVHPDSRSFAFGGGMGPGPHQVEVRNIETGDKIRGLQGHRGTVLSVAYSPDGRRMVTVGNESNDPGGQTSMKLWTADSGILMLELPRPRGNVRLATFMPDGETLVISGSDPDGGYLALREAKRSQAACLTIRQGLATAAQSIDFSPDGQQIASGGQDQTLRIWDATSGEEILMLVEHSAPVLSLDFSPRGKQIVSASGDDVYLWNLERPSDPPLILKGHRRMVYDVAYSPDGKQIVSGSSDGTLRLWNAENGSEVKTIAGLSTGVRGVTFGARGKRVIAACADKTVRSCDLATGREVFSAEGHTELVSCVAVSPNGKTIVSGSFDDTIRLWDAENGAEIKTLKGHTSSVLSVTFSSNGTQIISGSADRTIKVWDARTGEVLRTLNGHDFFVRCVAANPAGNYFASASGAEDMTIRIWNLRDEDNP